MNDPFASIGFGVSRIRYKQIFWRIWRASVEIGDPGEAKNLGRGWLHLGCGFHFRIKPINPVGTFDRVEFHEPD
jgi:hypothetical protein